MTFFSRTDFPVPEGPRIAVMRPLGTSKVMSFSTVWEPKDFVTPRSEMMASGSLSGSPSSVPGPERTVSHHRS